MSYGVQSRLARLKNPADGRILMVALDHGMALGPLTGLSDPKAVLELLKPKMDSILITKGILEKCFIPNGRVGVVMRGTGGPTIAGPDITQETVCGTVEDAIRMNADALSMSIYVGSDNEKASVANLARAVGEADRWGLPVLAITAVGKDREKSFDPRYIRLACRVAAEWGASLIKTYLTSEGFEEVVASCPVPVVIAGGPKAETPLEVLEMCHRALEAGAIGIDMGRNIWQAPDPFKMISALAAVVHERATPQEAAELLG